MQANCCSILCQPITILETSIIWFYTWNFITHSTFLMIGTQISMCIGTYLETLLLCYGNDGGIVWTDFGIKVAQFFLNVAENVATVFLLKICMFFEIVQIDTKYLLMCARNIKNVPIWSHWPCDWARKTLNLVAFSPSDSFLSLIWSYRRFSDHLIPKSAFKYFISALANLS